MSSAASTAAPIAVVLDCDGVEYDIVRDFADASAHFTGRPRSEFHPPDDFWCTAWGIPKGELIEFYRRGILELGVCRNGVPLPGSIAGSRRLNDLGVHIVIATDCGTDGAREVAREARIEWLHDWGFVYDEIRFTADKASVVTDLVASGFKVFGIDDSAANVTAMEAAGAQSYLMYQRWNRGEIAHLMGAGVRDLDEFARIVAAAKLGLGFVPRADH